MRDSLEAVADGREGAAVMLALTVLRDRVRSLPAEDRQDLYELSKIIMTTDSAEEFEGAATAMYEILEKQPACGVSEMRFHAQPPAELAKWLKYVSKRIRDVRRAANLTQKELAAQTGLPQSHISRLENGKHSPSRTTLTKVAAATGKKLSDLDPSA